MNSSISHIKIEKMQNKIDYILKMLSNSFLKYTNKKLYDFSQSLITYINQNDEEKLKNFIEDNLVKFSSKEIMLITRFLAFHEVLTNVVEDIYLNDLNNPWYQSKWDDNDELFQILKKAKSDKSVLERLNNLNINIVLTAHPTQVQRETTLKLIRKIYDALSKQELSSEYTNISLLDNDSDIQSLIDILWQVAILRNSKIDVSTELKNVLNYFDTTFFEILPKLNYKFEYLKNKVFKSDELNFSTPLTISSWIGGDRDGNPFVDANSLDKAFEMQTTKIFEYYKNSLLKIYDDILIHKTFIDDKNIVSFSGEIELANRPDEEFAKATIKIISKLENTYNFLTNKSNKVNFEKSRTDIIVEKYNNKKEFIDDLNLIYLSLKKNNCLNIANRNLTSLMYAINCFDFYLMSIDIRQNAVQHETVVHEILKSNNLCSNYMFLLEEKKVKILKKYIEHKSLNVSWDNTSAFTQKEISIFQKIKSIINMYGENSIKNYLISNAESVSDILEVLFIFKITKIYQIENTKTMCNIVPLFETINNLKDSYDVVETMINDSLLSKIINENWNNRIEVLLGYSDSCKDGGYLSSSWMLFNVQQKLSELGKKHNIKISFFHGRGGTIGRGGGPSYEAIKSQPKNSIDDKLRFTEQGEIIWAKYSNPINGWFNLEKILNAIIDKISDKKSNFSSEKNTFLEIMNNLSEISLKTYKSLVYEDKDFSKLFFDITPIRDISRLKIGSRPVSRNNKKVISDLRSIPWVFSWSQIRVMLPGWYGLGTTLKNADKQVIKLFQNWYQNIPFFKSLISNVEMLLSKVNINIAKNYFLLSKNKNSLEIYSKIKDEYEETLKIILLITNKKSLLEDFEYLKLSLKYRMPFLNTLNYIQVELLSSKFKKNKNIKNAILITINGIASGLRNSG